MVGDGDGEFVGDGAGFAIKECVGLIAGIEVVGLADGLTVCPAYVG